MNQKEYELIAHTLVGWYKVYNVSDILWRGLVNHMTDQLEVNYTNFDRAKFLELCTTSD